MSLHDLSCLFAGERRPGAFGKAAVSLSGHDGLRNPTEKQGLLHPAVTRRVEELPSARRWP